MAAFSDFRKGACFLGDDFEGFDLTGPSSNHNEIGSVFDVIVLDLVGAEVVYFLALG